MQLILILLVISSALTGVTYFFGNLYLNPFNYIALPFMVIGYVIGLFAIFVSILGIISFCVDINKEVKKPKPLLLWIIAQICQIIFAFLRTKIVTKGINMIPKESRFLLVSNHRSALDHLLMVGKLNKYRLLSVTKPENEHLFVAGHLMHLCGFIPIDRDNPFNAMKAIIKASNYIKNDEASVAISPEGTRSKDGELLPFHPGSFKIATKSQCPLVIACLQNCECIKKRFPKKKTTLYFDVLEVMSPLECSKHTTVELAEHSEKLIKDFLSSHKNRQL